MNRSSFETLPSPTGWQLQVRPHLPQQLQRISSSGTGALFQKLESPLFFSSIESKHFQRNQRKRENCVCTAPTIFDFLIILSCAPPYTIKPTQFSMSDNPCLKSTIVLVTDLSKKSTSLAALTLRLIEEKCKKTRRKS